MSDTLVAVVKRRASFSLRKYKEPPVTPNAAITSSSRQLSESHLCCIFLHFSGADVFSFLRRNNGRSKEKPVSMTYAIMKRSVKICAGERPLIINSFVHTNVVPQMATVKNATIWKMLSFTSYLNVPFYVVSDFRQILLHAVGVLMVDNVEKFFQLVAYL